MLPCFERQELRDLPVFSLLPEILESFAENSPVILTAEPGAGKSTAVPLALLDQTWLSGRKILMLEPRRIAAQSVARRMSSLLGESPGRTVGWRTSLDTCVSRDTRLEVVTEGILTRMLQSDPALEEVGIVIFDEFHERTLPADLGLALALDSRKNLRPDLRIALFSATLDSDRAQTFLVGSRLIHSQGRTFPVETVHKAPPNPGMDPDSTARNVAWAVREAWNTSFDQDILVFLPGWGEIQRAKSYLQAEADQRGIKLVVLHGSLSPQEQAAAWEAASLRKTVLSTSVAETSLTIPGVGLVIDAGLSRFNRFDPVRALNRLVTERVCQASADQRRGRAGRVSQGTCWRLWHAHEKLDPFLSVEMEREDLTSLVLECALWGVQKADELLWMTTPPAPLWNQARELLLELGALNSQGRITEHGKFLAGIGLEPRLGQMLVKAPDDQKTLAAACAVLLSESDGLKSLETNFALRLEAWKEQFQRSELRRLKESYDRLLGKLRWPQGKWADSANLGPLLALAFPDRIAQKQNYDGFQKAGLDAHFLMVNGRQILVKGELARNEYLVAVEADAGEKTGFLRMGTYLTKEEAEKALKALAKTNIIIKWKDWSVKAEKVISCGALLLARQGIALTEAKKELEVELSQFLKGSGWISLPWSEETHQVLQRIRFWVNNNPEWSEDCLIREAGQWLLPFADYHAAKLFSPKNLADALIARLGWDRKIQLDQEVPEHLQVPSGNRKKIIYHGQDDPVLEVRIQEIFGWKATPFICGKPVVIHLLSPAQRPLQVTKDLNSFWQTTYAEVRKEMRGRYPKHYWPEDPTQAEPTSRVRPNHRSNNAS